MRSLMIKDKCYKFFWKETIVDTGIGSISYEAHKEYSDQKLFFFRRDEAINSISNLLYFLKFGDTLAEITVDHKLVNHARSCDPNHFQTDTLHIKGIYDFESEVVKSLVFDSLRECSDFSKNSFINVVQAVIARGGFDVSAQ